MRPAKMLFLLFLLLIIPGVRAQFAPVIPGTVYFVSFDGGGREIWQASGDFADSQLIFTLPNLPEVTPRQAFTKHEIEAMENAALMHLAPDMPGVQRSIEEVWTVDRDRLLLLTTTHICEGGDGYGECFGYYAFLFLDITTGTTDTLLTLDYHMPTPTRYTPCNPGRMFIGQVMLNPVYPQFTFQADRYEASVECSQPMTYQVDYSGYTLTVAQMTGVEGATWSPDGTRLAYFSRENACQPPYCTVNFYVEPVNIKGSKMSIRQAKLRFDTRLFITWADNDTLLYRYPSEQHEPVIMDRLMRYNLVDASETAEQPGLLLPARAYRLQGDGLATVFGANDDGNIGYFSPDGRWLDPLPYPHIGFGSVFYNSRYPDVAFLLAGDFKLYRITADMTIMLLDTSAWGAEHNRSIFFVTHGFPGV